MEPIEKKGNQRKIRKNSLSLFGLERKRKKNIKKITFWAQCIFLTLFFSHFSSFFFSFRFRQVPSGPLASLVTPFRINFRNLLTWVGGVNPPARTHTKPFKKHFPRILLICTIFFLLLLFAWNYKIILTCWFIFRIYQGQISYFMWIKPQKMSANR